MKNEDIVPFFQLEQVHFVKQIRDEILQKTANAAIEI
jgi:hypothetical protein